MQIIWETHLRMAFMMFLRIGKRYCTFLLFCYNHNINYNTLRQWVIVEGCKVEKVAMIGGVRMIPNHYCGKLIAIDGPNGAGKSTIINGLKSRLAQLGLSCYFTKEPTESEIGLFTRQFAETNSGLPLALLVGADRYFHLEKEIIPRLQEGIFVFTDRYVLSSLILQCMDGVSPKQICQINDNVISPDLQIIVWADEKTLQARLKEREILTRFEQGEKSCDE